MALDAALAVQQACAADGGAKARNPQSAQELAAQAREAQRMMNQLTPEQRKMMEQMGIAIPDLNAAVAAANSNPAGALPGNFGPVPARNAARIEAVPKAALTEAGLPAYLESAHRHVSSHIKPASRELAEKVFGQLKSDGLSPAAIGNAATGLWVMGRVEIALYVMGKALALDPANTDNQNNYAAMLSMSGGEPLAIPLLDRLDRQFPRNSTIQNNLGQAWFNLGDIEKAERFLDEAIRIYALHPQANFTRSFIEESRGNKDKAVEYAKRAARYSLSLDKENRLRKLGYKLTGNDVRDLARPDPDPLGLSAFKHPAFPKTAGEEIVARREWAAFAGEAAARIEALTRQLQAVKPLNKAAQAAMAAQAFYTGGKAAAATGQGAPEVVQPLARRAKLMMALAEKDEGMKFRLDKSLADLKAHHKNMQPAHAAYEAAYQALIRKEAAQTGEGRANKDFCAEHSALASQYLANWNAGHEQLLDEYLQQLRLKLNEELYWQQFTKSPEDFAAAQIQYRIKWLAALVSVPYAEIGGVKTREECFTGPPAGKGGGGKLAQFNDLHCAYHSELNLVLGKITSDCNKMTTELGVGFLKLGLKQDMDKNSFSDQFVSCNVEVSAGKGADVKLGPLSVGVGAEAGIGIEIGRNGVQDLYLTGSVGAGVTTNVMDRLSDQGHSASMAGLGVGDKGILSVGTGGRISLISGPAAGSGLNVGILQ
jgi:tetratricopeptide (TPR) repeat protein